MPDGIFDILSRTFTPNAASAEVLPQDKKSAELADLIKNSELFTLLHAMPNRVALRYWPDSDSSGSATGRYLTRGESGYSGGLPEMLIFGKSTSGKQRTNSELLRTLQHELGHGLHDATRGIRRWPDLNDPRVDFLGASAAEKKASPITLQVLLAEMIAQRMGGGAYPWTSRELHHVDPFVAEIKGEASKYLPKPTPKPTPGMLQSLFELLRK